MILERQKNQHLPTINPPELTRSSVHIPALVQLHNSQDSFRTIPSVNTEHQIAPTPCIARHNVRDQKTLPGVSLPAAFRYDSFLLYGNI